MNDVKVTYQKEHTYRRVHVAMWLDGVSPAPGSRNISRAWNLGIFAAFSTPRRGHIALTSSTVICFACF